MSATNPHSPIDDPLETRRRDPKVRSRSKSMSSSRGQSQTVITPRRARPMRDLRLGRDRRMTKTSTSHSSREARSTHAMIMQTEIDRQRSRHPNIYFDRVHRGLRLSRRNSHDSRHVWRRTEVKDSYGVVHGGKAPISVQRHHRAPDPQLAQGDRLDLSPAPKVSDPSRGWRGQE
ncbi:hypothetical protein BHM03_00011660 [Ensete ventricosum]|nr:hypothetical protein BHM03_00011660 [Ensete ventricosum]